VGSDPLRARFAPRRRGPLAVAAVLGPLVLIPMLLAGAGSTAIGPGGTLPEERSASVSLDVTPGVPPCSALEPNATLNATYSTVYDGLPSLANGTPGPNSTRPANQSAYPSLPAGEAQLVAAWWAVCTSPAFASAYDRAPNGSFGTGLQLNGSTGDYQTVVGFEWVVSCAGVPSADGDVCETSVSWFIDLRSGQTDGPLTRTWASVPTGGPPREPSPSAPGGYSTPFGTVTPLELAGVVAGVGVVMATLAVAGVRAARRQRQGRAPGGEPEAETRPEAAGTEPPVPRRRPPTEGTSEEPDPLGDVY
jgi:hypothetical protein